MPVSHCVLAVQAAHAPVVQTLLRQLLLPVQAWVLARPMQWPLASQLPPLQGTSQQRSSAVPLPFAAQLPGVAQEMALVSVPTTAVSQTVPRTSFVAHEAALAPLVLQYWPAAHCVLTVQAHTPPTQEPDVHSLPAAHVCPRAAPVQRPVEAAQTEEVPGQAVAQQMVLLHLPSDPGALALAHWLLAEHVEPALVLHRKTLLPTSIHEEPARHCVSPLAHRALAARLMHSPFEHELPPPAPLHCDSQHVLLVVSQNRPDAQSSTPTVQALPFETLMH